MADEEAEQSVGSSENSGTSVVGLGQHGRMEDDEMRPQTAPARADQMGPNRAMDRPHSSNSWSPAAVPPRSSETWVPVNIPTPTEVSFRGQPEPEPEPEPPQPPQEQLPPPSPPPGAVPASPPGSPPIGARRRVPPASHTASASPDKPVALVIETGNRDATAAAATADSGSESDASSNSDEFEHEALPRRSVSQKIGSGGSHSEAAQKAKAKMHKALSRFSTVMAVKGHTKGTQKRRMRRGSLNNTIFINLEKMAHQKRCKNIHSVWTYAIHPHGRFRIAWDASMLCLVVWSCFYVPFKTAFVLERQLSENPHTNGMEPIDWLVDGIFYIDIILNFWTGYDTGYMVVTKKSMIAKNYLKTRFPIDLISTVEWDLIARRIYCGSAGCIGENREANDMTAVTRLVKVARLARAGPLIRRLTSRMTVNTSFVDALIFFLYVLVCAHVLACVFFMVPILSICGYDHQQVDVGPNGEIIEFGPDGKANHTCMATSWRTNYGLNDANNRELKPPWAQYLDAAYWSLTTMTTIGYGDRGPGNEPEVVFTMFSELVGLVFFVLLLDRITTVYAEVRREHTAKSAIKDEIVQFLSRALPSDHDGTTGLAGKKAALIKKTIAYLQFKNGSQTYSRMIDPDGVFSHLSEALQEEAKAAVFVPLLQELRLFGCSTRDRSDYDDVARMFKDADPDGSGELNEDEIRSLIVDEFQVDLTEEELMEAIEIMDVSRTTCDEFDGSTPSSRREPASITLDEFNHWWYLQKHGRPKIGPCTDELLHYFAMRLRAECSSPGDLIVRKGEYADRLYMVMQGVVHVRDLHTAGVAGKLYKNISRSDTSTKGVLKTITDSDDSDQAFGLIGVLNHGDCKDEYGQMKYNMRTVIVYGASGEQNFCECVYLTQEDLLEGLTSEAFGEGWNRSEPGSNRTEPALHFLQEYARNIYYKYYHPEGYYWGKYLDDDDYLKDPHAAKINPGLRSASFLISGIASSGKRGDTIDGRKLQLLETRLNDVEIAVKAVNNQVSAIARQQNTQHAELMAALSRLGQRHEFADIETYESTIAPARPHTAAAIQHHRHLEDLMASVRKEHSNLFAVK